MIFVVPVYNEAENLLKFISDLVLLTDPENDFMIFIDDGSADQSLTIISDFQKKFPANTRIVSLKKNQGLTAALLAGFKEAQNLPDRFFPVVTIDGDGQHNGRNIRKFLKHFLKQELDVFVVSRDFSLYPFWKKAGNRILSITASVLLKTKLSDIESGLRFISRRALDVLCMEISGIRYSIAGEIVYISVLHGFRLENSGKNQVNYYRSRPGITDFLINLFTGTSHFFRFHLKHFF